MQLCLYSSAQLPSTLICHDNRAFSKTLFTQDKFENTPALRLSVDGKHYETEHIRKQKTIQKDRRLLRFQISPVYCERKTFDKFSER